jgi:hypothetical protein
MDAEQSHLIVDGLLAFGIGTLGVHEGKTPKPQSKGSGSRTPYNPYSKRATRSAVPDELGALGAKSLMGGGL